MSLPANDTSENPFYARVQKMLLATQAAKFEAALPWHSRDSSGWYHTVKVGFNVLALVLQAAVLGYGWTTFVTPSMGLASPGALVLLGFVSLVGVARQKTPGLIDGAQFVVHRERAASDPAYKAAHVKTSLQFAAVMPLVYLLAWAWMAILACFV
jgi:hypothetical protein